MVNKLPRLVVYPLRLYYTAKKVTYRRIAEDCLVAGHKAQVAQNGRDADGPPTQRVLGVRDEVQRRLAVQSNL